MRNVFMAMGIISASIVVLPPKAVRSDVTPTPPSTTYSMPAIRYRCPSGMPAPEVESETRHSRPARHRCANRISVGGKCLPSPIISTVRSSDASVVSRSPGLRQRPSFTVVDCPL